MITNGLLSFYLRIALATLLLTSAQASHAQSNNYDIGVGISDVTGQIAETNFFGYGELFLRNKGIRDRQYARAYIIKEPNGMPVVFVCTDKGATFQSINTAVIERLEDEYGGLYTDENVIISASHTHSSPAGYSYYGLYNLSVGGFYQTNFDILVDGIVDAIGKAHDSMAPGRIYYGTGSLTNASANRSIEAYWENDDANAFPDIDPEMTVLKFIQGNEEVGMISWFAVHPTNLTKSYAYCSGDNKGYAALKFERAMGSTYYNGSKTFVAAFANTNPGDMTGSLNLPPLESDNGKADGPGATEEESSEIIGDRQYQKAMDIYNAASTQLIGSVDAVTRYNDFSDTEVAPAYTDGQVQYTCWATLGASFKAGSEEGRSGIGREGITNDDINLGLPIDACQMEKKNDILFMLGSNNDDPQTPKILPTSLMKIGQLGILAAPGEFTIMAGRRSKSTVANRAGSMFDHLVFAGYSDAYAGYVVTREEYRSQQYEGASTHFGPWTLGAYQQEFDRLTMKMMNPASNPWPNVEPAVPAKGPIGPDQTVNILFDDKPWFKQFGQVETDAADYYQKGQKASAVFWGAHPNNDPKVNDTYLKIQKWSGSNWTAVYEDRDVCTLLKWERSGVANSKVTVEWNIPADVDNGYYRILHFGKWKNGWNGQIRAYSAESRPFYVGPVYKKAFGQLKELPSALVQSKVSAYPNPTKGNFTLSNEYAHEGEYAVYDALGRVITRGSLPKGESHTPIVMSASTGIYSIQLSYVDGTVNTLRISITE